MSPGIPPQGFQSLLIFFRNPVRLPDLLDRLIMGKIIQQIFLKKPLGLFREFYVESKVYKLNR